MGVVGGGVFDGAGDGEFQADAGAFEFGPEDAGGVDQDDAVAEVDFLSAFGDGGFVADAGDFLAAERVDEGGFPDVGDADDHDAEGFAVAVLLEREFFDEAGQAFDVLLVVEVDGGGPDAALFAEVFLPEFGDFGVGEVGFGEEGDAGDVAVGAVGGFAGDVAA